MIYHLAPAGRIGMVLANGSLSSQSGGEGEIRKNIINADLVECIVAMPTQLFFPTQIPVSLCFINKQKKQSGKTLFIDARKMGAMVRRKLRELTGDDIQKIADTYTAFVDGTLDDVKEYCAVADTVISQCELWTDNVEPRKEEKLYKFVSERELGMVAEPSAPYGKKQ